MRFTIFIYKEYRPILLSGLKIENIFKMRKWISHLYRPLSRKFYVTSGPDIYSKMTQYRTSTAFFLHWEEMTKRLLQNLGLTSEVKNKGLVIRTRIQALK
jgi:hypothetical protein